MNRRVARWTAVIVCLASGACGLRLHADEPSVSFHREVLPILRIHCVQCHKPGRLKGGVDLTSYDKIMMGGDSGPILVPGIPDDSRLIETICGDEPEMPQDSEPLLPKEIERIRLWVSQGAVSDPPPEFLVRRPTEPAVYEALPAVSAFAFSPDGNLLAVAGRYEILCYDLRPSDATTEPNGNATQETTPRLVSRLQGDSPRLESIAFSRDGSLMVASGGSVSEFGEIQIWDVETRESIRSIKASDDTFYGVSISPDNRLVAVGCADKLVRAYRISDGMEVMRCDNHLDWVFGSAFTNDGTRLVTASRDKAAKLIDVATGHLIDDINRTRDPLLCLARHPVENLVATGGTEGKIRLFRMEPRGGRLAEGDNKEESFVREFEHMASHIQAIAFSPDGSLIACGVASGEVRIFNTENGQRRASVNPQAGPVFALAFSADGKQLAMGGPDGRIRFYDTEQGKLVRDFPCVEVSAKP